MTDPSGTSGAAAPPDTAAGAAGAQPVGSQAAGSPASGSPAPISWTRGSRPSLPSKVRLEWDPARGQAMLLFPEGVLVLNPTARAVLELCDGRRTLDDILRELAGRFDGSSAAAVSDGEALELSMDPGTDTGEHQSLRAARRPAGAPEGPEAQAVAADVAGTPAASLERERQIERDVVAFLQTLESRRWIVALGNETGEER